MAKKHLLLLFVLSLFTFHFSPLQASDWVLNESKYNATDKTDHLKLEVFLCDLDGKNTYCDGGTIIATNGSQSYELLTLKYHDEASDGSASENITSKLLMHNSKAWVTNATYGSKELTSSDQTFQVNKWASDHHYMTAEIDFYYPSELADDTWKIYFRFKHSNGKWYNMVLRYSIYVNNHLGLPDYNAAGYKVERTGVDKMTFTVPQLPNDIDSKFSSIRSRKATYNVYYTFFSQQGMVQTAMQTYEASTTQEKKEEYTFPERMGNPTRIDCHVTVRHGVKDPSSWFRYYARTWTYENAFKVVSEPGTITTDFRQFDQKAVLTWTTPSGSNYMAVTPYIYRVETDEKGTPKSGKSWSKRGNLSSTNGGSLSFTDDEVTIGTYFIYKVLNVPTDWINQGIMESSLNNPSDDLLGKLGSSTSRVMNTAPQVAITDMQQDTTVKDKVRLTWQYTRVPTKDATVNFKVLRRTSLNNDWNEIATISGDAKPAAGAKLSFEDSDLPNSYVRYFYTIRLELSGYLFHSDIIQAGLLSGTKLKEFSATKGTHDASVTLNWKAHQVGTANCNYIISRRYVNSTDEFMQIHSANGTAENYTYQDQTVQPGYYYEYSITVHEAGLPQNTLYAVGFCQSRGTVSGRVQYGSGTAVPDVRLWLRPTDTDDDNVVKSSSQYVHDASEGIAWAADSADLAKVFGADKDYTVQFFVRPDAGLSEGAVVANIPGAGQLLLGNATSEGYELTFDRTMHIESAIDINRLPTTDLSTLSGDCTVQNGSIVTGTMNGNYKVSIADGATIMLRNATIDRLNSTAYKWAGITCEGDATIVLEGSNTVKGFYEDYPGIFVPQGKTLTIKGTGSLTASSNGYGAGIGGGYSKSCGNIVIAGGTISAEAGSSTAAIGGGYDGACGNITITGGDITARVNSTNSTPGIGAGKNGSCGNITITNTVTQITAWKGNSSPHIVGKAQNASCGTITIGGTVYWDGSNYKNDGSSVINLALFSYSGNGSWASNYTLDDAFINEYSIVPAHDEDGTEATGARLPADRFSLLTLSKSGKQLSIQVDTNEVKTLTAEPQVINAPFSLGGASGITSAQAFKGNFAEVRVWNRVLTDAEKKLYYDRTVNGRESGLMLYWPLDEGLRGYAFDASYSYDLPNGRHATMGNNITPSAIVPTETQLARYGLTNDKGEYLIRGIPFVGSGSSYTIVPEKGIHEFNPKNRSLFISPSSLTANNIDFEDVSAFPMTGHIYYAGTNIPTEGIQLYVDGTLLTANGKAQQTDENGYYSISVPIGEHYVEAKLEDSHKMVDGGRFPITGTYNFVDRVQHDFSDSTLVNFVGRVTGAKYNDTIPVGFGESKNNIGVATITLKLNNESFSFNCKDDYIMPAETDRYYESDTASIKSHSWTGSGEAANTKYIYINTDSATGEFSAKLPPLKYIMKSVVINSNDKIEFGSLPEIDLTNAKQQQKDSIRQITEQNDTIYNSYSYNTKKVLTYYAEPQVDVVEKNHSAGSFGLDSIIIQIDETQNDTLRNLYTIDNEGVHYMFGYPIYQMLGETEYELHGYEAYTNYDSGKPVTDTVNLIGQELTVGNEMSADQAVIYDAPEDSVEYTPGEIYQMRYHMVTLDMNGRARLPWTAGAPNIVAPFTRQFNITLKRENRTYEPFRMNTIVLGSLTTGNNFVTQGPDQVQFILRDPYGAHSKTTLKRGQIHTTTEYNTKIKYGNHSLVGTILGGVDITVGNGLGVMMLTGNKTNREFNVGTKAEWQTTQRNDKIYEETTIESISTSDKVPYVGAQGDIYVGTAKNILVGTCRKVFIQKNAQTGKYEVVLEDALALGQEINTAFAYTQYELEKVMIPKWKDQRKQFLTFVGSEQAARSYVNHSDHLKSVTWLDKNDPDCGEEDTYVVVEPQVKPEETQIDSVQWCNNQIKAWEEYIRQNEEAKIKAINEKTPENYSIDGGSSRTFTSRHDTTRIDQNQTTFKMGAVFGAKVGFQYSGFISFGAIVNFENTVGKGSISGTGNDNKNYTEWEYVLADGNRDVDISINMYEPDKGGNSRIFTLFGGQTYNPYEPADSTHQYQPDGRPLPLGNGTVRMEQPYISIGKGDETPGKSVTLTDIPAGQTATATLYCTNMGNTNQGKNFSYDLGITERSNPKGLEILMDGTPINGRAVYLDQSETTRKVITIRQTDESVLDYDSIEIRFMSQFQPQTIYDVALLSAHFKPSSSPVELTVSNPVINTDPTTGKGKLSLKVSGFNRQFRNLKNIGIQYRFAGNTQWTDLHTWETQESEAVDETHVLLPPTGDLKLTVDMSNNISYPEGEYEFRAYTTTPYDGEQIHVYSEVMKVIKDMTLPRPLFTPAPANGILGIGDQLAVEFNEDIVPGYVGDKNIIITAKLNGRSIDHEVSLRLLPYTEEVRTVNPVFLNGNFSLEMWLNVHNPGIILHQGAHEGNFSLSFDKEGHIVISVIGKTFRSQATLPTDKWLFIAMNYKAQTMTFSMQAQYDDVTTTLFLDETMPMEEVEVVSFAEDNYLYLGPIDANIHGLALYNIYRDVKVASSNKYVSKDEYTYGLTNYWPMNEGHGLVAADERRTHDFRVNGMWTIYNTNYSLRMDSIFGGKVDISLINTTHDESYAIEMWYNTSFNGSDTVFETDNMCLRFDTLNNLVLDYGTKSKTVAATTDFTNLMTVWHHFALNVVRGQAASFYTNGKRTAVIAETDVPVLKGASLAFAKNAYLGSIDELRIWKATLSEERLLSNMYNTIDTSDVYSRGLIAYYPFEKDTVINGIKTKGATMQNMAPKSNTGNAGDAVAVKTMPVLDAPPLKNAPSETRITAVPVASERKVVINLSQAEINARDIEGTTLNITLAEIHDLHGNMSNPIKWTAFVQQNTLKWLRDSVNINKKYGEDYTFDVDIMNMGGQTEYYTVANMPEWLSLVESGNTDDLQPLKSKTLRFAVNPYVPVNDYDVTIGLQGNNEILEPLRIVMKVRGETPDWTVDPTLYDHSMTIIGQVYLGGILMENSESLVAAFIGGECRGVAAPEKIRGAAYVTLPVYGHDDAKKDAGKPLTFRIWDASRGVAYTDAVIQLPTEQSPITDEQSPITNEQSPITNNIVIFHDGLLIGNFDYPALWTKSDKVEQLLSVHENWNWITFGVEPESQYCDILFADYGGWGILLKDTAIYIQSNGAEWKGLLKPAVNRMYKMKITRTPATATSTLDPQMSIRGRQPSLGEMPVQIAPKWNWMAYTPLTTKRIGSALAGLDPSIGDIIKSQTAVAIYGYSGWEGTLTALEPGHGYLYFSTDSVTKSFRYPEDLYLPNGMMGAPLRTLHSRLSTLDYFTPVDKHNYQSNMTMTIRLLDGEAVVDTCEIAAFVGDECRGAVRADEEGLYYLVITGEGAGEAMEIKTVLNGEIVTIDNTLTFTSDDHIGTPWEPYVINLQKTEGIDPVTGNPSAVTVYKVIKDDHVFIIRNGELYDVTGAKIR